ncbi:MAG: C39 family peptidase [Chloroflexota bacterium]|nr:C39 family peptidase [Chloroflexota bacterium]
MGFWRKALAVAFVLGLIGAQLGNAGVSRAANGTNVDSWIELSSTAPSSGCLLESAVEIRSGGYALAGVDVFMGIFVGSDLISGDRVVTDANGIAYLTVNAALADGQDAWVDITLNDTYWWGTAFYPGTGDSCYDSSLKVTESGPIATNATAPEVDDVNDVSGDTDAVSSGGAVIIPEVGFYVQQRNLSCEYASLYIATAAWGRGISEYNFDNLVGWSDNPHIGYRGNIHGWWGNTTDYGVYAEPLSWALAQYGFVGEVAYTGGAADWLIGEINAGNPVLVWLALWGDQSVYYDGYMVTAGLHVLVAYGYDDGGVYLSDPAIGGVKYYDWATFQWMWGIMDGMGLSVYPA